MITLDNIRSVAKYESKLLTRSWFYRLFLVLAVLFLCIFNLQQLVFNYGNNWLMRALPSNIPYINLLLLNTGQAIIAVFLSSEFLKADKKLDTSEVFYVHPLSNAEYVFGKIWGNIKVFFRLDLIIISLVVVFNFVSKTPLDWGAYVLYFILICVPTLIFIFGLSVGMMLIFKNQAITFVVLLGYIALTLFYISDKFYYLFDYMVYNLPLVKSSIVGYTNWDIMINHRLIYLLLGIGFLCISIFLFRRLPNTKYGPYRWLVIAIVFIIGGCFAGYRHVANSLKIQNNRELYVQINNKYASTPKMVIDHYDITVEQQLESISAEATLLGKADESASVFTFCLNPTLQVSEVTENGDELSFTRDRQIILIDFGREIEKGDSTSFTIKYNGRVDESFCYLDIPTEILREQYAWGMYHIDKKYSFQTTDYILFTPETYWYPRPGVTFSNENPDWQQVYYSNYRLTVKTINGLKAISQGALKFPAEKEPAIRSNRYEEIDPRSMFAMGGMRMGGGPGGGMFFQGGGGGGGFGRGGGPGGGGGAVFIDTRTAGGGGGGGRGGNQATGGGGNQSSGRGGNQSLGGGNQSSGGGQLRSQGSDFNQGGGGNRQGGQGRDGDFRTQDGRGGGNRDGRDSTFRNRRDTTLRARGGDFRGQDGRGGRMRDGGGDSTMMARRDSILRARGGDFGGPNGQGGEMRARIRDDGDSMRLRMRDGDDSIRFRMRVDGDSLSLDSGDAIAISEIEVIDSLFIYETDFPAPAISLIIGDYEQHCIEVDYARYNVWNLKSNNFFVASFDSIIDTLPSQLRMRKSAIEASYSLSYSFKRFSIVETPIQFQSYTRTWTMAQEKMQPEMVLFPEKGCLFNSLDVVQQIKNIKQGAKMNGQDLSDGDAAMRFFNMFMGTFQRTDEISNTVERNTRNFITKPNPYFIFPQLYNYRYNIFSSEWTIANRLIELYLQNKNDNNAWMRQANGISNSEKANLLMQKRPFKELLVDPEQRDILDNIIALKAFTLFAPAERNIGNTAFRDTLRAYLNENIFTNISFEDMLTQLSEIADEDLSALLDTWDAPTNLPVYLIGLPEITYIINRDVEVYVVKLQITNDSEYDGIIDVETLFGGGGGGFNFGVSSALDDPRAKRKISFDAGETKQIVTVWDQAPRGINVNTLISANLPNIINQPLNNIIRERNVPIPEEGDFLIENVSYILPGEVIVDNEDAGLFEFSKPDIVGLLPKWLDDTEDNKFPYSGIDPRRPPLQWTMTTNDKYYGTHVRSAHTIKNGSGSQWASWKVPVPEKGFYDLYYHVFESEEVRRMRNQGGRGVANMEYQFKVKYSDGGEQNVYLNLQRAREGWNRLGVGVFDFRNDDTIRVILSNNSGIRLVTADAVKIVRRETIDERLSLNDPTLARVNE